MTEPAISRKLNRNTKFDDETFEGTLRDILITDIEGGEINSPLKNRKTTKARPQTGRTSSILSSRRKP